ncbi:signal transduction histidine kinase [Microcella alkaliphila]|uniref:Signal transduction histidine kinase n=1 Tax=Microcella alkaliphila TaxID=279828 RepID=A0A4V6MBU9_9MICO|nr:signal transduction histidine kinase [Microcella alkaliphila]
MPSNQAPTAPPSDSFASLPAPRGVTAAGLVRGLSAAMRWIGPVSVLLVLAVIGETAVVLGHGPASVPLVLTLLPVLVTSLALAARPSVVTMVTHLGVGLTIGTAYAALATSYAAPLGDRSGFLVEGAAVALIFVGALGTRGVSGIGWILAGLGVGTIAIALGAVIVGEEPHFSPDRVIDALIMVFAFAVVDIGWRRSGGRLPAFRDIARETRRADERRRRERSAAAVVHDTVLSDLAAIAHGDGALDERMRDRIRADLTRLEGASATDTGTVSILPREGTFGRALLDLVEDYRWRGGRIDLAGTELLTDDALPPVVAEALHAAVAATLDNVRRHASAHHVELTLGGDDDRLTVLVVDDGLGFDVDAVAVDRLGLRESIIGRMERAGGSARIWSSEAGTTVLLSAPRAGAEAER